MNNTYPSLKIIDIETTIHWYADFLGFQCSYKSTIKDPEYAVIENGNQKLYLIKTDSREAYASNIIIVETPSLKEEYEKLESAGVIIVSPISKGAFSEKEFIIKDYEDNKLMYVEI